jgi:hypothetical protein
MRRFRDNFRRLALVAALLGSTCAVWAQTSQITGRVSDPSDSAVAGAKVRILCTDTDVARELQTNAEGYFIAPLLPRGRYEVSVQQAGFKPMRRSNLTLDEGQIQRLDFPLQVGDMKETVQVTAAAPVLEKETGTVSAVITNEKIDELPLLNRNVMELTTLVPTVRPLGDFESLPISSGGTNSRLSISGASYSSTAYQIDGIAADHSGTGIVSVFLSPDATEEFRVITRNPSAEFGRLGGGAILIASKSGTNKFHGSAFDYLRNSVMNANDFFSNRAGKQRGHTRLNQWGATLGGPLVKQRTFFFFNYEGLEQRPAANVTRSMPTAAQRAGDFQGTLDASRRQVMIYDPLTTRPSGTGYMRDGFPSNAIPASRISPIARAILEYLPLPNQPGVVGAATNNYYAQGTSVTNKRVYGLKVDHNFNAMRRISARYTNDTTFYADGPAYFANAAETAQRDNTLYRHSAVLTYTHIFRPTLLLELRGGLNAYSPYSMLRYGGFEISKLGFPAALQAQMSLWQFPQIAITDITTFGSNNPQKQGNYQHTYAGSLTQIFSRHTVKYGGEFRAYQQDSTQPTTVPLSLSFSRTFTQGPNPNTSGTNVGSGMATFLLGYISSGAGNISATKTFMLKYGGFFVQDDWKVTPRLTLNLGLRAEHEGAYTDRYNAITNFDPYRQYTAGGIALTGAVTFPGNDGVPRGVRDTTLLDIQPRFGFAYQLSSKTILRGGWGLFYLPSTGLGPPPKYGYDMSTSVVATDASIQGGFYPTAPLSNPLPKGLARPLGAGEGPTAGIGSSVVATGRWVRRGIAHQFNFSVQRELPSHTMLELGYAANRGMRLQAPRSFTDLPFSRIQKYSVTELQATVPNPYCPVTRSDIICRATRSFANTIYTYPQFSSLAAQDNWGDSIYHALTLRVERRFAKSLTTLVSYTFSKELDNNVGTALSFSATTDGGNDAVQDWENLRLERAISSMNLPHRLVTTVLYNLPFGRSGRRVKRALIGDWQINGILTLQSGMVIGVITTAGNNLYAGSRPNQIGDPKAADQTIDHWLNPAAFTAAAQRTPGNAPRNLTNTRTDSLENLNFSLLKNVFKSEKWRMQFRAVASNLTNTPVFGMPGRGVGSSTFGVVTTTVKAARNVQLGLKLQF